MSGQPMESWTDEQLKAKVEELDALIKRMSEERATILREISRRKGEEVKEESTEELRRKRRSEAARKAWKTIRKKKEGETGSERKASS